MGRLSNLRAVDPVLTNLAVGYRNAEMIADKIFPMVKVNKEAGKIPKHNKQAFKLVASERALRAKSNRLDPEGRSFIDFTMDEHDLSVPMDYREADESDDLDVQAANTMLAQDGIDLRREKIAADMAFNPANFSANNKVTLGGVDKWNLETSNPISIFRDARNAIRSQVAKRPNVLALGASAFEALSEHPKILERLAYSQMGVLTADLLALILRVEEVVIGDAIYTSDDGNTSYDIWGDSALLYYRRPVGPGGKRSVYEPSFGYTVAKKLPEVDKYMEEGGKLENVRNTMIFKTVLTGADAGFLISDVL